MVISSPRAGKNGDAVPNEFDITSAKNLIGALYRARLIDRDAEDRLSLHYERFSHSPTPPTPGKSPPGDTESPDPILEPATGAEPKIKAPCPEANECPFDTPLE